MAAKLFSLETGTVREILKLHALDGATPRRVKKLFGLDGSTVRLIFEDFAEFVVTGTANLIQSPVNEVIEFGVRSDFNAGGADVGVSASASGDASNVGGISGLSIDVDSSHTYSTPADIAGSSGVGTTQQSSAAFSSGDQCWCPSASQTTLITAPNAGGGNTGNLNSSAVAIGGQFRNILGGSGFPNWTSGSFLTINGTQQSGTRSGSGNNSTVSFSGAVIRTSYYNNASWIQGNASIGNIRIAGAPAQTATGRRARVVNGSNRTFYVSGGGLTSGGNFSTGNLSSGASTGFVTANSTNEAWTLSGTGTKIPASFAISNASNSISVSGNFSDSSNASSARDQIQAALNGNSTFTGKFNTGTDSSATRNGTTHQLVTFTSDSAENTSDFTMSITQNDGSNTTPFEQTSTQGAAEFLQTQIQVTRAVEGSQVSSTKAITSQANIDTMGAEVATLGGDITYDSSTNKLKVQDRDASVSISNPGSAAFTKQ